MANKKTVPFIAKCSGNCGGCRGAGTGPDCPETDDAEVPTMSLPRLRAIKIFETITDATLARVDAHLEAMLDDGDGPILVLINTPGGGIIAGLGIHELLVNAGPVIVTAVVGNAYSAGSLILQAGDTRLITPGSSVMIHRGSSEIRGAFNRDDLASAAKAMAWEEKRWDTIIANRTGRTFEEIEAWSREEKYMSAVEAVRLGFADAVLLPRDTEEHPGGLSFLDRAKERVTSAIEGVRSLVKLPGLIQIVATALEGVGDAGDEKTDEND